MFAEGEDPESDTPPLACPCSRGVEWASKRLGSPETLGLVLLVAYTVAFVESVLLLSVSYEKKHRSTDSEDRIPVPSQTRSDKHRPVA